MCLLLRVFFRLVDQLLQGRVGDLFMSLIYTSQLNDANPFDYLTQLQRHADQVAASPQLWMPWNYRAALA